MRLSLFSFLMCFYCFSASAQGFSLPKSAVRSAPADVSSVSDTDEKKNDEAAQNGFDKPEVVTVPVAQKNSAANIQPTQNAAPSAFALPSAKKAAVPAVASAPAEKKAAIEEKKSAAAVPAEKTKVSDVDEKLSPVERWLSDKGRQLLTVLSASNSPEKKRTLIDLGNEIFLEKELARMVIGRRYWNLMSPAQQDEYVSLFVPYFVAAYGAMPLPVNGVSFRMNGMVPSGKYLMVKTEVDLGDAADAAFEAAKGEDATFQKPEGSTMEVYFAVLERDGAFYICDVNVMGKRMVMVLRGMLERLFQSNSSDPKAFLTAMQSKIDKEDKRLQMLAQFDGNK